MITATKVFGAKAPQEGGVILESDVPTSENFDLPNEAETIPSNR